VSATVTSTGNNGKALAVSKGQTTPSTPTQQAQATTLIGGKPIMPTQTNIAAQPLVLSIYLFLHTFLQHCSRFDITQTYIYINNWLNFQWLQLT
jgi:hypothetical protein